MYVHNFDDGDDYIEDPFALISRLDMSDPLHLHPNDSSALTVVSIKLKGTENYHVWSCVMILALKEKNKTVFIDGSYIRSFTDEVLGKQWDRFLMGLNDSYMQIKSSILSTEILPDVRSAYATISSKPSNTPPRPNNLNNNRQSGGSCLICENYGFNGHTIDRCFKIIGYPADFEKKKSGQNSKGKYVLNYNVVGSGSSSGFTDEQMATLVSLINDNKVEKNMQANMTGYKWSLNITVGVQLVGVAVGSIAPAFGCFAAIRAVEFDNDQVPPLHSEETQNSWSLVVVTLTAIAVALPNIADDHGEGLIASMRGGLRIVRNIEEYLNAELVKKSS
nr:ribonuclease H-like domain-containing protein [Tanacetum cinerariifolium]